MFRLVVLRHGDAVSPDGSEGAALATGRAPAVGARVLANGIRPNTEFRRSEDDVSTRASDEQLMQRAIELAATARTRTSPNPWVGCAIQSPGGELFEGATEPPGGPHAEVVALRSAGAAGSRARRSPRPSSRARITAAPLPVWTRSSLRASRVSSSASKTPTRMCEARASPGCGPRGSRSPPERVRTRCAHSSRPI